MTLRIAMPSFVGGILRGRIACLAAACGGVVAAAEGPTTPARPRIVDPAVVTAGAQACSGGACQAGCRHGHHAGCRDGICAPSCPVRPQQFGFYGTQWRKWPGREVMQVSGERALAPALPPRSAVPDADAESLAPPGGSAAAEPAPPNGADVRDPTPERQPAPFLPPAREPEPPADRPEPELPPELEPEPEPRRESLERAPMPAVEPEPQPRPEPEPIPEPSPPPARPEPPRPEDENLFDEVSGGGWRARRRFPVGVTAPSQAPAAAAGGVQPAMHDAPVRLPGIPRVPFDPAAETRRLRAIR